MRTIEELRELLVAQAKHYKEMSNIESLPLDMRSDYKKKKWTYEDVIDMIDDDDFFRKLQKLHVK